MKHFRLKSSLIILALVSMLGYNVYCLVELYGSVSMQTHRLVMQSLRDADLDEIMNRSEKYPAPDSTIVYAGKQLSQSRTINGDTLIVAVYDGVSDCAVEVRKQPLDPGTNYSDIMVDEIGYGAHQTFDGYWALRISDLDSLFRLSLARKGLYPDTAYVVRLDSAGIVTAGDPATARECGLDSCSIIYNTLTGESYRAYYTPLGRYVFRQMRGIVVSTAGIILLLVMAFRYLLRTVSTLRSIEEMKDDFINNMTHELKTPIAIAYSANDALLNYDADNDPLKKEKYLQIANKQLRRLGELVENILAMSMERRKSMTLKMDSIKLRPFIDEIAAAQRMRADKAIAIDVAVSDDLEVVADRTHLANVLNNLIDNAIKYSRDSVEISLSCDASGITVADNGIGLPAKSLPYLFNKFYRVPHGDRQDVRGYGIGLYYVKTVLDKMGWSIEVKSTEGVGTVFKIIFGGDER